MKVDLQSASTRSTPAIPLPLSDAQGVAVMVMWGKVWLTQEGDIEDHVLHAGDTKRVDRNGLTLMQALDEAAVSILRESETESPKRVASGDSQRTPPVPYY